MDIKPLENLSKDGLVEEYYKIACPLPQRQYRRNRRGLVMARKQIMVSKRKRTHDESESRFVYIIMYLNFVKKKMLHVVTAAALIYVS